MNIITQGRVIKQRASCAMAHPDDALVEMAAKIIASSVRQ